MEKRYRNLLRGDKMPSLSRRPLNVVLKRLRNIRQDIVSSSVEISRVDPLGKGDVKDDFSKEGRLVEDMLSRLRKRLDTLEYEDQVAPLRKYMHIHHAGRKPSQERLSSSLIRDRADFPKSITAREEQRERGREVHPYTDTRMRGDEDDGGHLMMSSDDEFGPHDDIFVESLGEVGMQFGKEHDVSVPHEDDNDNGDERTATQRDPASFVRQCPAWADDSEQFADQLGDRSVSPSRAPRPPSRQRPPPEALDLDFGGSVLPTNPGLSEMVIDGMDHVARVERRSSRGRQSVGTSPSSLSPSKKRSSKKMEGRMYTEDQVPERVKYSDGMDMDVFDVETDQESEEVGITADDREIAALAVSAYERFQKKLFPARKYSSPDSRVVDEKYRHALMSSEDSNGQGDGGRGGDRRDKDAILEKILEHYQDLQSRISRRSATERKPLKSSSKSGSKQRVIQKGRRESAKSKVTKKVGVSGDSHSRPRKRVFRPKIAPSRVIVGEQPVKGTRQRRVSAERRPRKRDSHGESDAVQRAQSPSLEPWGLQVSRRSESPETRSDDLIVERMEDDDVEVPNL
eukprot:TRINITY_DN4648_c0_g1_i1.p1 TRINITY_DN4648_c0_g1~~TRINITY_DN4648_c0_g1_i1.p1  ORF type:complete len:594 (-),score=180.70 TRINITY_DN4648_c0_g1_i1:821-2533(-)